MKKLFTVILICIASIGIAQSYRGTLSEAPDGPNGFVLRTTITPTLVQKNALLANLGLTITGTSLNIALTGSTGLIVKSGTVTTY